MLQKVKSIVRELARCLVAAGRVEEARAELERALALVPAAERLPGGEETRARLTGELEATLEALPAGPLQGPELPTPEAPEGPGEDG